ncbi:MAG: isochorismatase family protein [Gammaproteobacteria bacterium]|nr:isochorismatase family protein [Gammaproteobacteria bacterium]
MPKKSALLVIDVQKSFLETANWDAADYDAFAGKLRSLIAGAMAENVPVVHIFHVEPEGPFSRESGLVAPFDCVIGEPAARFEKSAHNAFTTTGLGLWLSQQGINHLTISGIRTEQCCETTARVASDLGYAVDFVTEATLSQALSHANGRTYSPAEIKERTELVLDGRFARIVDVSAALGGMAA